MKVWCFPMQHVFPLHATNVVQGKVEANTAWHRQRHRSCQNEAEHQTILVIPAPDLFSGFSLKAFPMIEYGHKAAKV